MGPISWQELFFKALWCAEDPALSFNTHLSDTKTGAYGNVNGHGVRVVWQNVALGGTSTATLTIAPGPVDSIDAPLPRAEERTVTTDRDPDEVAAEVQRRLSAMGKGPDRLPARELASAAYRTPREVDTMNDPLNDNHRMAEWERAFWRAFDIADPAWRWQQKLEPLADGRTVLGSLGTIDGCGVRIAWQSARSAVVTMARDPIESLGAAVRGSEQTLITTDGDPVAVVAYVRRRLAAFN